MYCIMRFYPLHYSTSFQNPIFIVHVQIEHFSNMNTKLSQLFTIVNFTRLVCFSINYLTSFLKEYTYNTLISISQMCKFVLFDLPYFLHIQTFSWILVRFIFEILEREPLDFVLAFI